MAEKEYIERGAAIEFVEQYTPHLEGETTLQCVESALQNVPAADVVEVRHGEWGKEKWVHTDQHICSLCHSTVRVHTQSVQYKFCPYCGAKMKGGER